MLNEPAFLQITILFTECDPAGSFSLSIGAVLEETERNLIQISLLGMCNSACGASGLAWMNPVESCSGE